MINDGIQKECKLKLHWNTIFHPLDWQKSRSLKTMLARLWKHALLYTAVGAYKVPNPLEGNVAKLHTIYINYNSIDLLTTQFLIRNLI